MEDEDILRKKPRHRKHAVALFLAAGCGFFGGVGYQLLFKGPSPLSGLPLPGFLSFAIQFVNRIGFPPTVGAVGVPLLATSANLLRSGIQGGRYVIQLWSTNRVEYEAYRKRFKNFYRAYLGPQRGVSGALQHGLKYIWGQAAISRDLKAEGVVSRIGKIQDYRSANFLEEEAEAELLQRLIKKGSLEVEPQSLTSAATKLVLAIMSRQDARFKLIRTQDELHTLRWEIIRLKSEIADAELEERTAKVRLQEAENVGDSQGKSVWEKARDAASEKVRSLTQQREGWLTRIKGDPENGIDSLVKDVKQAEIAYSRAFWKEAWALAEWRTKLKYTLDPLKGSDQLVDGLKRADHAGREVALVQFATLYQAGKKELDGALDFATRFGVEISNHREYKEACKKINTELHKKRKELFKCERELQTAVENHIKIRQKYGDNNRSLVKEAQDEIVHSSEKRKTIMNELLAKEDQLRRLEWVWRLLDIAAQTQRKIVGTLNRAQELPPDLRERITSLETRQALIIRPTYVYREQSLNRQLMQIKNRIDHLQNDAEAVRQRTRTAEAREQVADEELKYATLANKVDATLKALETKEILEVRSIQEKEHASELEHARRVYDALQALLGGGSASLAKLLAKNRPVDPIDFLFCLDSETLRLVDRTYFERCGVVWQGALLNLSMRRSLNGYAKPEEALKATADHAAEDRLLRHAAESAGLVAATATLYELIKQKFPTARLIERTLGQEDYKKMLLQISVEKQVDRRSNRWGQRHAKLHLKHR